MRFNVVRFLRRYREKSLAMLLFRLLHRGYVPKRYWEDRWRSLNIDDIPFKRDMGLRVIQGLKPSRVLEVGCGKQNFSMLSGYVGVDLSKEAIMGRRDRVCASVVCLPFREGVFDVSVSRFVLMHVPEGGRAVRELQRVSRAVVLRETRSDKALSSHCFSHDYDTLFNGWSKEDHAPFEVFKQ